MIIIGRKSRNTDQALIKAGIELIAQGNYDPTVRAICTLANVNQGMFVYYFGFKEEYMKVLFQKIYEDYLSKLQDYPEKDAKAAIQLQQIFYRMTKYFIENFNTANCLLFHKLPRPAFYLRPHTYRTGPAWRRYLQRYEQLWNLHDFAEYTDPADNYQK